MYSVPTTPEKFITIKHFNLQFLWNGTDRLARLAAKNGLNKP